jgi:hypothetical protein
VDPAAFGRKVGAPDVVASRSGVDSIAPVPAWAWAGDAVSCGILERVNDLALLAVRMGSG